MTSLTEESQTKRDLCAVRALLSGPEKWTKGVLARDANGQCVGTKSHNAVSWCLSGAFLAKSACDAFYHFSDYSGLNNIPEWNDAPERTFDDIARVLDSAIEDAQ